MKKILLRLWPFLIISIAVIAFFPKVILQNEIFVHSGMVLSDLFSFNYPVKLQAYNALRSGEILPMWTDLIGNGFPLFAEGQSGAMYPLQVAFFLLPLNFEYAFIVYVLTQYILGGAAFYIFARKSLHIGKLAGIFGSLIFMFCGSAIVNLQHINVFSVMIYLPINFLIVDQLIKIDQISKKSQLMITTLLIATATFLQITAGHIETFYFNTLITGMYIASKLLWNKSNRNFVSIKVLFASCGIIIGILLSSYQLFATFELIKLSQRSSGVSFDLSASLGWPLETLQLFYSPRAYPIFSDGIVYRLTSGEEVNLSTIYPYIGILPLLFIVIALFLFISNKISAQQKPKIIIFSLLTIIMYIYAVGSSTTLFSIFWETIPGMKMFRYSTKVIYILLFLLSILATIGFDEVITKTKDLKLTSNKFVNAIAIILLIISYYDLKTNNAPLQPSQPITTWLSTPPTAKYFQDNLSVSKFHDWRAHTSGTDFSSIESIQDYKLQKDLQNLLPMNFNMVFSVPINQAYAGLTLNNHEKLNELKHNIDMENKKLSISSNLKKIYDIQSVRFLTSDIPIADTTFVEVFSQKYDHGYNHKIPIRENITGNSIYTDTVYIYENKDYAPKIRFIENKNIHYANTLSKQIDVIKNDLFDSKRDIASDIQTDSNNNGLLTQSLVEPIQYSTQKISLKTQTDADSVLVISDTMYPGWIATVDNIPTEIHTANATSRAIILPKGEHSVEFKYVPTYQKTAIILTSIGILCILTLIFAALYFNKKNTYEILPR